MSTGKLSVRRYLPLGACLSVLCGLVLHFLVRYLPYALGALRYPYSMEYGEGIVWQQALLIPGDRMYASIDAYPFIVFHYTPVYHLFARLIAHLGLAYLTSGRLLSFGSTLSIAFVIGLLTVRSTRMIVGRRAYVAAAIGGLAIFTAVPVFTWSPLMRVDMLAVALSFAGVYLAALSIDRPALVYWASVVFVLALYTKQTSIAAPLASLSVLLLAGRRRQAVFAASLSFVVGSVIFLLLYWKTRGGFARHILLYNINRFDLRHGLELVQIVFRRHAFYLVAVAFYLLTTWWSVIALRRGSDALVCFRARLERDRWFFGLTLLSVYLIVSTILLAGVAKIGSWQNYFIEWICVWCALLGMASASALGMTDRAIRQAFATVPINPFSNGPRADAYGLRDGLRRLPALDLPHNLLSTARRQPAILMHVHPVLRWTLKLQQPQLPRSEPDGQLTESSQLANRKRRLDRTFMIGR